MNDLEKLFEHAPEGATELKVSVLHGYMRWFNGVGDTWCESGWFTDSGGYKTIATRPQAEATPKTPETLGYDFEAGREKEKAMFEQAIEETAKSIHNPQQPRKTVENAVEWAFSNRGNYEWPEHEGAIYFDIEKRCLVWGREVLEDELICTREEFEAFVAAKAKSEPEWTHLVNGSECVLLDPDKDCDGYYITKTHYGSFELAKEHELKPIKPTISKAEAWDMLTRIDGRAEFETVMNAVMSIIENHNITN